MIKWKVGDASPDVVMDDNDEPIASCHTPEIAAEIVRARNEAIDILRAVNNDDRYHREPAPVVVNAPLALIQVSLKAQAAAAAKTLGVKPPKRRFDG